MEHIRSGSVIRRKNFFKISAHLEEVLTLGVNRRE